MTLEAFPLSKISHPSNDLEIKGSQMTFEHKHSVTLNLIFRTQRINHFWVNSNSTRPKTCIRPTHERYTIPYLVNGDEINREFYAFNFFVCLRNPLVFRKCPLAFLLFTKMVSSSLVASDSDTMRLLFCILPASRDEKVSFIQPKWPPDASAFVEPSGITRPVCQHWAWHHQRC